MHQGYFSFQMSLYAGRVRLLVVWPYLPYASMEVLGAGLRQEVYKSLYSGRKTIELCGKRTERKPRSRGTVRSIYVAYFAFRVRKSRDIQYILRLLVLLLAPSASPSA